MLWGKVSSSFSLFFLVGFGFPPRCPHVGRALCPKGLLSAVALASLVTERMFHLCCFFLGGLFLMASLGMQRSHAVVLFSTLCPVGQGFFSFQKVFPCLEFHCIFWTLLRFMLQLRKGHMVQGKLASAGTVHCLHNRDTQTLGH